MCNHDTVTVHYRVIDMLRDMWRQLTGKNGLTPDECGGYICVRCGKDIRL